jgi:hypothetical protein
MSRKYLGIELRKEQVEANRAQVPELINNDEVAPFWVCADSRKVCKIMKHRRADFLFTCPPYYNLEVYSDDPADISTASSYHEFLEGYETIIADSVSCLADNRFAAIVVGDLRDKDGAIIPLVNDTIAAFEDSGAMFYNDIVFVTAVGSLPIRVGKQFDVSRKIGRMHQRLLVFCKGNPRIATEELEEVKLIEGIEAVPTIEEPLVQEEDKK